MKRYPRWRGKKEVRGEVTSLERWSRVKMAPYEETPSDILFKGEVRHRDQEEMQNAEKELGCY